MACVDGDGEFGNSSSTRLDFNNVVLRPACTSVNPEWQNSYFCNVASLISVRRSKRERERETKSCHNPRVSTGYTSFQ
ncbi:hypothetical protein L2E82_22922 [Cichorium intybus]|uniref:Uncharacterized protein n=1 Tax=Cichorium intybus TaxID=13427 RepID=A0ACB9DZB4_CICIN|nr:hypothetical protein L2E82_22922 [Cichorium intybus]